MQVFNLSGFEAVEKMWISRMKRYAVGLIGPKVTNDEIPLKLKRRSSNGNGSIVLGHVLRHRNT